MKKMFFSVLMMLFVAFAYAEGTPASTKLPVEKISVKKFSEALISEALKNEQIPSNAIVKEIKTELKQAEVTQEQIGDPVVVIIISVTIEIYDEETGEFFTFQAYLIVVITL
jgi:hypothetical protein